MHEVSRLWTAWRRQRLVPPTKKTLAYLAKWHRANLCDFIGEYQAVVAKTEASNKPKPSE